MPRIDNATDTIGRQYYQTQLGTYDEMFATEKKALPHWERLMVMMENMGSEKLELRRREAQRLLQENGVTYNVYGDSQKLTRPWQLDPVPLLISNEDWLVFEAGLKQRAELLNLILKDIYDNQTLLKKGLLPFELIFGHDGFLHACVGAVKNQQQLNFYAANLARDPNGQMWVLDDRAQAPSGSGYSLENRAVMTRVLPDLFREIQVQRLSGFFKVLYKSLCDLAPHNTDDPRIVVLTPGPFNETYFEHAYLAAYLGITLVQGGDLTVRDGRVWLKSLSGLLAVDVILRRVDDSYCDPLELLSISQLGVPGLLEVVRRGNVAVANPLGSSVLENPGLLAFLPGLSRYYLNEDLILPSVATWWCGQRRERDFVLQNFDNLVIKPINRSLGNHAVFTGLLSNKEKEKLRTLIINKPHLYVGQEQVSFSTLPSFFDNHIEPRNAVLRTFVAASDHDYAVMPGGLTRIATQKNNYVVSNQSGGISKDTWVLASESDKAVRLITTQPKYHQTIDNAVVPLTSRAADNLFWVGRYIIRIEASARLLKTVLQKLRETFEYRDAADYETLKILLPTLTHISSTYPGFVGCGVQLIEFPHTELIAIAADKNRSGSLAANIQSFIQCAYNIRDLWSHDTWRAIDHIQQHWFQCTSNNELTIEQLHNHLDDLITGLIAFTGLTGESMTREATWLMLDSGRQLERALTLIALLRSTLIVHYDDALQNQLFEAILVSTDSLTIYQRRYRSFLQLSRMLELLLLDEAHPRSVAYQLSQLSKHIGALPHASSNSQLGQEERLILRAYTDLRLCSLHELTQPTTNQNNYIELEQLLSSTENLLRKLSEIMTESYFSHSQTSKMVILNSAEDEL